MSGAESCAGPMREAASPMRESTAPMRESATPRPADRRRQTPAAPVPEDTLFLTVRELSDRLASGAVTSVELTQAYLDRAEALDVPPFPLPSEPRGDHGGKLATMVTIARNHALEAAGRADRELAAGRRRSILHGLPYGVKDLLDTRGIRTTWGSGIFADRVPDRNAAVIDRLEEAGAVMMAKMSLGEFAGGNTSSALNPWKLDRTSFGSSSGTVSAAVAGLIGFGIGTETGGSIVFPASAVGASGLRPTFGRVSRFGCMALSWSLDKIGPVGRSAEDCGHILQHIAAHDPRDSSTVDRPFAFRPDPGAMRGRRLGVHRAEFELSASETTRRVFREALEVFAQMGVEVEDVELPLRPTGALFTNIVTVESGTNFKSLFDDGSAARMFSFNEDRRADWMAGRMLPAGDYLTAQRIRSQLVREADEILSRYDAVIAPTWPNGAALREVRDGWPIPARNEWEPPDDVSAATARLNYIANLVGHPGLAIPCGFDEDGLPLSLQIVGSPMDDQSVLDLGMAYQRETDWHLRRPPYPWRE